MSRRLPTFRPYLCRGRTTLHEVHNTTSSRPGTTDSDRFPCARQIITNPYLSTPRDRTRLRLLVLSSYWFVDLLRFSLVLAPLTCKSFLPGHRSVGSPTPSRRTPGPPGHTDRVISLGPSTVRVICHLFSRTFTSTPPDGHLPVIDVSRANHPLLLLPDNPSRHRRPDLRPFSLDTGSTATDHP